MAKGGTSNTNLSENEIHLNLRKFVRNQITGFKSEFDNDSHNNDVKSQIEKIKLACDNGWFIKFFDGVAFTTPTEKKNEKC